MTRVPAHDPKCYLCPGNERAGGAKNPEYSATYLKHEEEQNERIVIQNGDWVVLLPYWATWPYETLLLPRPVSHEPPNAAASAAFTVEKNNCRLFIFILISSICLRRTQHTSESDMASGSVDCLRVARRRPVALAVIGRTKIRAALDHFSCDARSRLRRIVALRLSDPAWVARRATRSAGNMRVTGGIPILGPLPDIAGHIEQAVTVGRK